MAFSTVNSEPGSLPGLYAPAVSFDTPDFGAPDFDAPALGSPQKPLLKPLFLKAALSLGAWA